MPPGFRVEVGARDRNRTGTCLSGLGILSRTGPFSKHPVSLHLQELAYLSGSFSAVLSDPVSNERAEFGRNTQCPLRYAVEP